MVEFTAEDGKTILLMKNGKLVRFISRLGSGTSTRRWCTVTKNLRVEATNVDVLIVKCEDLANMDPEEWT